MDSGPAPEYAASVLEQDVKDVDIEIAAKETLALPALRPRPRAKLAPQLLALPHELLLHLLRYLTFADIERLRRTCKALRALASPRQIRILVGAAQLHAALLSHCKTCLFHDPFRSALLLTHPGDVGYPLSSRCVECAFYARDARFRAGAQVLLGNYESVWVCRWCGRPVSADAAPQNEKFHVRCYRLHHHMLLFFFLSGCLQLALGITGAALAWRFFRGVVLVFAPTVINFILLFFCLAYMVFCAFTPSLTCHHSLILELAILGLWIPPVHCIVRGMQDNAAWAAKKSTAAALAIFFFNILFRLLNVIGNIALLCGYMLSSNSLPDQPLWRTKLLNPFMVSFAAWTYTPYLDGKAPPEKK